jgi:hypothetical protein
VILNDHNNKECENTCVENDPFINISESNENIPIVEYLLNVNTIYDACLISWNTLATHNE